MSGQSLSDSPSGPRPFWVTPLRFQGTLLSVVGGNVTVMRIDGKLAVVSGGAVGIGRAIAQRLAAAGAEVVVADIDVAGGRRTRELIGSSARFMRVDMRDDAAVTDLMACQPQILVNTPAAGRCFGLASPTRVGRTGWRPRAGSVSGRLFRRLSVGLRWSRSRS